jgi:hypothetical protein
VLERMLFSSIAAPRARAVIGRSMETPISIARTVVIVGGALGGHKWYPGVRVVDGIEFVQINNMCSSFARFCVGKPVGKRSPLGSASTVADLIAKRDMLWYQTHAGPMNSEDNDKGLKRLFDDEKPKKKRRSVPLLPTALTMEMEPIAQEGFSCSGCSMKVLCEKVRSPLWVELREGNLEYLRTAVFWCLWQLWRAKRNASVRRRTECTVHSRVSGGSIGGTPGTCGLQMQRAGKGTANSRWQDRWAQTHSRFVGPRRRPRPCSSMLAWPGSRSSSSEVPRPQTCGGAWLAIEGGSLQVLAVQ